MGFMVRDTGGADFTPAPAGTHLAICNAVVDLGIQETTYLGSPSRKHQCFIRWELINERIDYTDKNGQGKGGPMSIGKTYTASLSDKANLRKDLESWRGRAFTPTELQNFDLFALLGVPCQVSIVHEEKNGKTYANVKSVAGWPKGMAKPAGPENPLLRYNAETPADYARLPQWLRDKIDKQIDETPSDETPSANSSDDDYAGHDLNDDIPF